MFFYYVLWQFISSPFFAGVATKLVNDSIPAEYRDAIKFEKIRVGNFPPRIIVEDISLNLNNQFGFKNLVVQAQELQIGINVFSSYRDKFSLSHVKLYNGFTLIEPLENKISEDKAETELERKKQQRKQIKKEINNFVLNNMKGFDLGEIIVSRFELEKMYFKYSDQATLFFQSSSIETYREKIFTELDIEDFQVDLEDLKGLSSVKLKGVLDKNSYDLDFVKITKGSSILNLRGAIKKPFDKNRRSFLVNFSGEVVPNEISQAGLVKELGLKGVVKFQGESIGRRKVERVNTVIVFKDFRSKFLEMDKGVGNLSFDGKKIMLNKLRFELDSGEVQLKKKALMYDFKKKVLLNDPIKIALKNVPLDRAIVAVPPVSKTITGKASGEISLLINKKVVNVEHDTSLEMNEIGIRNEEKEIFRLGKVVFDKSQYTFDLNEKVLTLKTDGKISDKQITVQGTMSENNVDIASNDFYINFDNLIHLGDLDIKGYGKMKVQTSGSLNDLSIRFDLDTEKTELANFYMGRVESKLDLDLKNAFLKMEKVEGEIGTGNYSMKGSLDFKNKKADVRTRFKEFNIEGFRKSHGPALAGVDPIYWTYISGILSGEYHFLGGFDLESLEVTGTYLSDDLTLFKERINSYRANMRFKDMKLDLRNVEFDIGNGRVEGSYSYDLNNKVATYGFESEQLNTKDLNYYLSHGLGYSSKIKLKVDGVSDKTTNRMNIDTLFFDSVMSGQPVKDSRFILNKNEKNLMVNASFLEDVFKFNSTIDIDRAGNLQNADFNLSVDIPHWSYVLNLVSSYDVDDNFLRGRLVGNVKGSFNVARWNTLNLVGGIQLFSFEHPEIDISSKGVNAVQIENGEIKKWIFNVVGSDNEEFISTGTGSLRSRYKIDFRSRFILDKINRVLGSLFNLKGGVEFLGSLEKKSRDSKDDFNFKFKGNDVSISRVGWFTSLDNTFFEIVLNEGKLNLKYLQSKLGNGDLKMNGTIDDLGFDPDFNIKYQLDDAVISINERSYFVVNGTGNLLGSDFPYALSGEIRVIGGEVFDEFEKFINDDSSLSLNNTNRYTPRSREELSSGLLSLNLNTTIEKEIWFRNSLVDFKMLGGLNITGSNEQPLLFGKVFTNLDKENKVVIKDNELFVEKLMINFSGSEDYTNPLIDFSSNMKTNDYKITVQAYGPAKNLSIDFSSDPYLNRQSILSLMAFGYVEQYSERLSQSDRESISSAGVGSFLFNRLKINETLKDNLGVTLNVGTVFQQDEQSFLQGRTQSGGQGGSVRSATKLELNKKITDNVDLSVSSAISGSIGQQQKMNVNYNINKNVSLQGVYELTTDRDGEEGGQDTSVGADVKFRWTFK